MAITKDDFLPELNRLQLGEVTRVLGELDDFTGRWRRAAEVHADRLARLRQRTTTSSSSHASSWTFLPFVRSRMGVDVSLVH